MIFYNTIALILVVPSESVIDDNFSQSLLLIICTTNTHICTTDNHPIYFKFKTYKQIYTKKMYEFL